MYTLVTHNAVGTVYRCVGQFETVEAAEDYWDRWHHTGLGPYPLVIRASDEAEIRRVNNERAPESRRLYLMSERNRAKFDSWWRAFLLPFDRTVAQIYHDCHFVA